MLTLYPARSIITMNPSQPRAEAMLVRDDHIVEVGAIDTFQPWLQHHDHRVDDQFANDIICPGFIDPHLHPAMAAVLLPMEFVTAMRWKLPWGEVQPVTDEVEFDRRVRELAAGRANDEPLFIWGYHQLWHGRMSRERINAIAKDLPIVVWHRSFHELYMNDGALAMTGIDSATIRPGSQIDFDNGHFFENGLSLAIARLNPWILAPERFAAGLERLKQVVHHGGQTTIGDLAVGLFDFDMELAALKEVVEHDDTPFRVRLVPHGAVMQARGGSAEGGAQLADTLVEHNTHRLQFAKHVKLFSDGAFFSQLAQMLPPGYIDGHEGEWLMLPEALEAAARPYWQRDYQIHVHVTGDRGLEAALDVLAKLQSERPRFAHGFTMEHFGFANHEQIRRLAELGGQVSANVYYLHELADAYAASGIGYERASQMARLGSAMATGMNVTFHSDFTMAPGEPLNSMWVGVNRLSHTGEVMCPEERLTPQQALEAITINAARVLGMADRVGSLQSGKLADCTVLADDPLVVDPLTLRDIPIRATMFEGRVFPTAP